MKEIVAKLEDAIITISGPALAISGIIAGVDLVTGGNILRSLWWLSLVWAITLLLTLDFQVLALGVRAHRVYSSNKDGWRKFFEIALSFFIAAAISYVSIQMQSIIARVNAENVTLDLAASQLGINMIWLIWERSSLVLVLIFISGWLREHEHDDKAASAPAPMVQLHVTRDDLKAVVSELLTEHLQLAERATVVDGTDIADMGTVPELAIFRAPEPLERIAVAHAHLVDRGDKITIDALQGLAHVRRQTVVDWMKANNVREEVA